MAPDYRKQIGSALHNLLKPQGFKKKDYSYERELEDVIQFINLQSSTSSTSTRLVLTVNVGVLSKFIPNQGEGFLPKPDIWSCQWRRRLGYLMPDQADKWWIVENQDDAENTTKEMTEMVEKYALSILARLSTLRELDDQLKTNDLPRPDQ